MANTTNFNWETPDDTDLVKDGAAAMRTLGNAIDASFVDLKGGTTGQVLSKASNTDLDFTWVAQDDSNAIQNAIVDAKGDLISATAADTPARLPVGTNGQVLTADSTQNTGLAWTTLSANSMTQLATGTLSGTSVNITSISGSYQDLVLVIQNAYANAINNTMYGTVNSDTGTNYETYRYSPSQNGGLLNYFNFYGNLATTTAEASYNRVTFYNYAGTNHHKGIDQRSWNQLINSSWWNIWKSTSAITSIQLKLSGAASFSGGTYTLYGVK